MTTSSRAHLLEDLRRHSEVLVLGTALLFLTFASLWAQFALGPLMMQPANFLAWLLVHAAGFLALRFARLSTIMLVAAFTALQLYFKNSLIDFAAPFLPMAPVFFLIASVTLTGYRDGRWLRATGVAAAAWASVYAWSTVLAPDVQHAQMLPLVIGAVLSVALFGAFFGSIAYFTRYMAGQLASLGPRTEYNDKRIHASKLQTLGELAASVAHEINTPLTSIKGYNYQIKMELGENPTPDRELLVNFADRVAFNLDRVAQITKVLKNFARDPSREEMRPTSLREVFADTLTLMKHHVRSEGVDLVVELANEDVRVSGSLIQLSQLLVNLLTNAKDACAGAKLRRVTMGYAVTDGVAEVWVEDSGPGIPEALRAEVFRPFFTTKEVGKGTGLGLHISQLIAERHQSRLEFSCPRDGSGKALGTRFYLRLAVVSVTAGGESRAA